MVLREEMRGMFRLLALNLVVSSLVFCASKFNSVTLSCDCVQVLPFIKLLLRLWLQGVMVRSPKQDKWAR